MEGYKVTTRIEPTDNYQKAKQDLIQAILSIQKLPPQQRQKLATELFGAAKLTAAMQIFRQYFS